MNSIKIRPLDKNIFLRLYDARSACHVLGNLMKSPSLLRESRYKLYEEDFEEGVHRYVFKAIKGLFDSGVTKIGLPEIEGYLNLQSPKGYLTVFETPQNRGVEFIQSNIQLAKKENFDYHYSIIRKFSILRDAVSMNMDISHIIDLSEIKPTSIEQQRNKMISMSIEDILQSFSIGTRVLENKHKASNGEEYLKLGSKTKQILDKIVKGETYGMLGSSGIKNRITYGLNRRRFHLSSGGSGVGKSRNALNELRLCTVPQIWSDEKKSFIVNPNNPENRFSSIYIGTELSLEYEVSTIAWSIVSGVEQEQIKEQNLTREEWLRVCYAIYILQNSKIHAYKEPNYSISYIQSKIEHHLLQGEDVYCIGIDYIEKTNAITKEALEYSSGTIKRDDEIFLFMSKMFKEEIADKYNLYVISSTQLNRNASDPLKEKDAGMIRGSFSLVDKVDIGSILAPLTQKEKDKIADLLNQVRGWNSPMPNQVEHVFKNRVSSYSEVRIFRYVNLGNMKTQDFFLTDWNYKLIPIEQVISEETDSVEWKKDIDKIEKAILEK